MSTVVFKIADGISPELRRIKREMDNPRAFMAGLGKQLEIGLRKHFAERNKEPNAMGWPKRNFWQKQVQMQTALTEVTNNRAVVTIASPAFVHKVYGGTIYPKRAKRLSIPLTAQAYAAGSASLFPGKLKFSKGGLVDEAGTRQYALVRKVTHRADPRAWPETAQLEQELLGRAKSMLARILRANT